MRLAQQFGQKPRFLQENATIFACEYKQIAGMT
jgi:hypothetical protein